MNEEIKNGDLLMLYAAISTGRPQLMDVFLSTIERRVDSADGLDPDEIKALAKAARDLALEVYDQRRAISAMLEANKHVFQTLSGINKYVGLSREIALRAEDGRLPDDHSAGDILATLKEEMEKEYE